MEVMDQVKGKVDNFVNDVSTRVSDVQENAEVRFGQVKNNAREVIESLKEEVKGQSGNLKAYRDRLTTKFSKHFNGKELVSDIREEVDFFSGELKASVGRIKSAFDKKEEGTAETAE